MLDTVDRNRSAKESLLKESAWLRYSSPLFSALTERCAEDPEMIELATQARPEQPVGLLFPIVAHYLLLKSPDERLSQYFPSIAADPKPAREAYPEFRQFCLDRREEFTEVLARRTVNTNLVERASCILPSLAYVSALAGEPLTLIEICCSAGLNLHFDQYHYDYGPLGKLGSDRSALKLGCKSIGSNKPPVHMIPRVAQRVGVDLVKIDLSDPLERLWMEAALCPEWAAEREHFKAALSVLEEKPAKIIMGNALDLLPSLLDELPGSPCVLHSYCMAQWNEAGKHRLDEILRNASRHREIHRIGLDSPAQESGESIRGRLAKLASAGIPLRQKNLHSLIEHTHYCKTDSKFQILGHADGFGAWIDWQVTTAS